MAGLQVVPFQLDNHGAKFDLSLGINEQSDQLHACFTYNTDLFDQSTVMRMAQHFNCLLEAICSAPQCRIADLPMLTQNEQRRLLLEWNDVVMAYPKALTLHQLFEAQAASTPDQPALVYGAARLSYGQLNTRANRLAHYLRSVGVVPDQLVGLCVERSPEMLVALLAILKAGGAYVPLDPAYPVQRLASMLHDAKPVLLLTQQALLEQFQTALTGLAAFCLDSQAELLANCAHSNPANLALPHNLAYVIYTSGSTGKPKGTGIAHRSAVNLAQALFKQVYQPALGRSSTDLCGVRVGMNASISFDGSVKQWLMLLYGAALYPVPEAIRADAAALRAALAEWQLDVLDCTPSQLTLLLSGADAAASSGLAKLLLIGGEAIDAPLLNLLQRYPAHRFYNMYGPTEATVDTLIGPIEASQPKALLTQRIANVLVYLLDPDLNPVPAGVTGQLHIGGDGLARGYLNRPDLTAEKFIPDPFAASPGARMYQSGDAARYLPGGEIEVLGRIDNQVKIRGFRIELGEIEAALRALPQVAQAAVVAREDTPGDKRLVAYLVCSDVRNDVSGAAAQAVRAQEQDFALATTLRAQLAHSLPDYMIPAHFVSLHSLPLSTNGKLDHRALPAPNMTRSDDGYVAPTNAVEAGLAAIWATVLKLDRVGIHDNFFELGGHSLLLTQIKAKLQAAFQIDLPLRSLYEAPAIAALAARIERAQQDQAHDALPIMPITPIAPTMRGGPLPLSFAQQRLWFLEQLEPGASYNIPSAWRILGQIDVAALRRAFKQILARHEALRTTFANINGAPVQIIGPVREQEIVTIDLRAGLSTEPQIEPQTGPQTGPEARAQKLMQDEMRTPFDLARGPLLRVLLLRLYQEEHILLLTLHHIVADGWSMRVLMQELSSLYRAQVLQQPPALPELPLQYADFAHWQQQWLSGPVLARQLEYWIGQLADIPTLLALPTDRPRPSLQTRNGATHAFTLPAGLGTSLGALSKQAQCTLFMTLCAAFAILLARYSRQCDICIGAPVAGRNRSEIEDLIGMFVNTLVLRIEVDSAVSFNTLLQRVRHTLLDAYTHQDAPFEQLVEALKPERHLSHSPLFQVMLSINNPGASLTLPGLRMAPMAISDDSAKFDLSLDFSAGSEPMCASFEYNTDLFDAATIERMAGNFTRLLEAVCAEPNCRVGDLPMLSEGERRQLLVEWHAASELNAGAGTIHQMFEAQAARAPERVALVLNALVLKGMFEGEQLTYGELNARANRLGAYLRSLGVGPDKLVAICVERSLEMIIGLLGIWKAGGAYVPIDPNAPEQRMGGMLNDAKPLLLLTQASVAQRIAPWIERVNPGLALFCLDRQWDELSGFEETDPQNLNSPDNLAYVIYTSGSTGKPKGVLTLHRGVVNLAHSHLARIYRPYIEAVETVKAVQPERSLRASFNAPYVFDASVSELILLLTGHTLYIIADEIKLSPEALAAFLKQHQLDVLDTSPLQLKYLLEHGGGDYLPAIVLVGGEATDPGLWKTLCAIKGTRFFNTYGPTECTIDSLVYPLQQGSQQPLIGKPEANTQVYLLDPELNPVPVGVAGELHIAGDGVGRGYLHRPDLTAEKFIPNPFSDLPGARMYQTGDLARYLPDGNVDYLGRIDNQVKIRGFRIELGEIEAALIALPQVQSAVVLAREDAPGDKRLVAYWVPAQQSAQEQSLITAADMRAMLARSLPDYMIPAHFVLLQRLPLTGNGKLDRKALPQPDLTRPADSYAAPANASEAALAAIWAEILKLEQIGVHDNFFELGGHSLLCIKLVHAVKQRLQVALPLAAIFSAPTVAGLAAVIAAQGSKRSLVVQLQGQSLGQGQGQAWFCLHPVGGQILFYQQLAQCLQQPVYGIQAPEMADLPQRFESLAALAAAYCLAIRQTQAHGPYRLLGWSSGGLFALAVAAELEAQGQAVSHVCLLDTWPIPAQGLQSPAQLQREAALTMLAALRGASFGADDLQELEGDLDQHHLAVADLFQPGHQALALLLLQKWLDAASMTPEMMAHLAAQLAATGQHLAMLSGFAPPRVQARLQVIWASAAAQTESVQIYGSVGQVLGGGHYGMLKTPHVQALGRMIAAFSAESTDLAHSTPLQESKP